VPSQETAVENSLHKNQEPALGINMLVMTSMIHLALPETWHTCSSGKLISTGEQ
jgi:hypothetical protein